MIENYVSNSAYYDSAGSEKNSFKQFNPATAYSGDQENLGSWSQISARAWDLIRNNPTSNSLLSTLGNGVIGTGLKVLPQIDWKTLGITKDEAKKKNDELLRLFNSWARSEYSTADRKNNFYMFQMRSYLNAVVSGDSFTVLRNNSVIDKTKKFAFDLTCEGVDSNSVCNPQGVMDTNLLAGGIKVNQYNEEISYYFKKKNLDSNYIYNAYSYDSVEIPRYGKKSGRRNVLHFHVPLRFNERRGVSIFAPLMEALKQFDRFEKSEVMKAVLSSFLTGVIKTEGGDGLDLQTNEYGDPIMGSGTFTRLNPGESIDVLETKQSSPEYVSFETSFWNRMSSALGMSMELVKIRFDTSYTAARAALLTTFNNFKIKRTEFNFLINQPIFEEFVTECVLKGKIELEGFLLDPLKKQAWLRTSWIGDAMMILDPIKEMTAAKMARQEQLKTTDQLNRELTGNTYSETLDQLDDENQMRKERELLFPDEYERETKRFDAQRKIEASEKVEDDSEKVEDNSEKVENNDDSTTEKE